MHPWSKRSTPALLVRVQTHISTLEIIMTVSQKTGNPSTSRSRNTALGHKPKDTYSYREDICLTVFIAALFIKSRTWKQPLCSLAEEWIKKTCCIYAVKYYSVVKNKDILKFAGKFGWNLKKPS